MVTNNVAAIGALVNGVWPMRKVAELEAERRHMLELELKASGYDGSEVEPESTPVAIAEIQTAANKKPRARKSTALRTSRTVKS